MSGRIENLGDYNAVRLMLQKRGGDLSALIKDIKIVGAQEALPKYLSVGLLAGTIVGAGGAFVAYKISEHVKNRRQLRDKEREDRLESVLAAENTPNEPESEEPPC